MDRLVAVDGKEVDGWSHERVVDSIRESGSNCCLLVVNKETDDMYKMVRQAPPSSYWLNTVKCSDKLDDIVVFLSGQRFSYDLLGPDEGFKLTTQLHRGPQFTCSCPTHHTCARDERRTEA